MVVVAAELYQSGREDDNDDDDCIMKGYLGLNLMKLSQQRLLPPNTCDTSLISYYATI